MALGRRCNCEDVPWINAGGKPCSESMYPEILLQLSRAYNQRCNYGTDTRNSHATMSVESAYRALELEPGASMDRVKAAYRRLALKW